MNKKTTKFPAHNGKITVGFISLLLLNQPYLTNKETMADPTVSTQITDAVTQANVKVLGDSPAMALSNLYQTISQSLSLSAQNAVTSQQQSNIVHQATTTQGVSLLYSVDTAAVGAASGKALRADSPDVLANIMGVVEALKDINR